MPLTAESVSTRSFGGFFREDETDLGLIGLGLAHRHVVDFDHEVGTGLDEFSLAGRRISGGLTGRVADQEIAGQRAGVGLFVFLRRRRHEKFSRLLIQRNSSSPAHGRTR